MKGSFEKSMAEGRKLPAVFSHYIVPDATEGQLMAFAWKDLKVLKYSIEVLVLILIRLVLYISNYQDISTMQEYWNWAAGGADM